ncbi:Rv3654c family TadE-like protein [Actinomyces qiguomingii]|uniref:Rv3654c family TadE-like protein n=1 Tax=Actinomyces qiguomingii TaxID=2057800 RepID=UPI000CA016C1|nr:Rv3654c family TadE-like protein [Actinomyces qiguomingii]
MIRSTNPPIRSPNAERGSGTVMVLGIIAVALCLALGATALIQAQAASGRARSAADLAALAGATALNSVFAPADPCVTAQRVARANGGDVAGCNIDGEDVTVTVTVPARIVGIPRRAEAAARAGPVNPL